MSDIDTTKKITKSKRLTTEDFCEILDNAILTADCVEGSLIREKQGLEGRRGSGPEGFDALSVWYGKGLFEITLANGQTFRLLVSHLK